MSATASSYIDCACRDCFNITITGDGSPTLCSECEDAGCDVDGTHDCACPNEDVEEPEDAHDAFVDVYGDTVDEDR